VLPCPQPAEMNEHLPQHYMLSGNFHQM
jgi:hypothetical protein